MCALKDKIASSYEKYHRVPIYTQVFIDRKNAMSANGSGGY